MRIILLCGGSGKRLWPLSNGYRSKLFLKLLPLADEQNESMIQRVTRQLESACMLNSAVIVAHHSQTNLILDQIGEQISIISEPFRRGTFNAIALSAVYLSDCMKAGLEETVCVLPVDLFVNDDFYEVIKLLPLIIAKSGADLALLGITPTHPADQYGYILPQQPIETDYLKINKFLEKPDTTTARTLMKQQALWNCGIFAFNLRFMLDIIEQRQLPASFEKLNSLFENLPESSFDEEVAERTSNAVVVPYHGSWQDLGSWESLTQQLASSLIGRGSISEDSINTHLINQLSIPIHIIGARGLIVAANPDGILVADKKSSNSIKKVISDIGPGQDARYEEKRWGSITVLDHQRNDGGFSTRVAKIIVFAGAEARFEAHEGYKMYITILSGSGEFVVNDHDRLIHAGDFVQVPVGINYLIKSTTPLEFIQIHIDCSGI